MAIKNQSKRWYQRRLKEYYVKVQRSQDPRLEDLLDRLLRELQRAHPRRPVSQLNPAIIH